MHLSGIHMSSGRPFDLAGRFRFFEFGDNVVAFGARRGDREWHALRFGDGVTFRTCVVILFENAQGMVFKRKDLTHISLWTCCRRTSAGDAAFRCGRSGTLCQHA